MPKYSFLAVPAGPGVRRRGIPREEFLVGRHPFEVRSMPLSRVGGVPHYPLERLGVCVSAFSRTLVKKEGSFPLSGVKKMQREAL